MGREQVESINISRASTTTNLFYLFFHGGKAALIPFLTLFFRLIGLSALEAGGLIAAKTVTGLVWAPLWARCATAFNRHRLVLIFSLFMMMVTYLTLPALYTQLAKPEHCGLFNNTVKTGSVNPTTNITVDISPPKSTKKAPETSSHLPIKEPTPTDHQTTPAPKSSTKKPHQDDFTIPPPVLSSTTVTPRSNTPTGIDETATETDSVTDETIQKIKRLMKAQDLTIKDLKKMKNLGLSPGELQQLTTILQNENDSSKSKVQKRSITFSDVHHAVRRAWSDNMPESLKEKLHSIQNTLQNDKMLLFLVLLAVIVGGEIFASPVEKVADDSWFDFLNRIDDLERYGQQRFWGTVAFILIPISVCIAVDHSPCFLPYHLHHYLIHIYVFVVMLALALLVSCWYPVPPPASGKYTSKICKGLRVICCDGRGFLFSVTLLLTGMVYSSYHNFLFWRIQDLGGPETAMGLCVAIGAFSEIPMLVFSGRFVKKIGNCWAVSLSLIILALRTLYYAYIPNPWAILPVEITHGLTHTSLWFAILSYDDFNIGAAIDRSLRSILSSFYFGFGFSFGSIISGYIFDTYGPTNLFLGCSALIGGWCVIFSIVQKFIPKKEKVRYIKLLRSDSDNSDSDDDWLEMALKDH